MNALRGCYLLRDTSQARPTLQMFKVVGEAAFPIDANADTPALAPKRSAGASVDMAVKWLVEHGYTERGAFVGEEEQLAVFWLKPDDEPEYLAQVVGKPIVLATVRYVRGEKRFATTRTASEIQRSRRRNSGNSRDLAFIRLPTKSELLRAYGLR